MKVLGEEYELKEEIKEEMCQRCLERKKCDAAFKLDMLCPKNFHTKFFWARRIKQNVSLKFR